jgi:hypothetical protein
LTTGKAENEFIFVFLILQIDELNHRNRYHRNHRLLLVVVVVVPGVLNDLVQLALEEMDHEMELLHHYRN